MQLVQPVEMLQATEKRYRVEAILVKVADMQVDLLRAEQAVHGWAMADVDH